MHKRIIALAIILLVVLIGILLIVKNRCRADSTEISNTKVDSDHASVSKDDHRNATVSQTDNVQTSNVNPGKPLDFLSSIPAFKGATSREVGPFTPIGALKNAPRDNDGNRLVLDFNDRSIYGDTAISPDGKRIITYLRWRLDWPVAVIFDLISGKVNIFTIANVQIGTIGTVNWDSLHPDYLFVVIVPHNSKIGELWRVKYDGNNAQLISDPNENIIGAYPTPDGKWLIISLEKNINNETTYETLYQSIEDPKIRKPLDFPDNVDYISPNSAYIEGVGTFYERSTKKAASVLRLEQFSIGYPTVQDIGNTRGPDSWLPDSTGILEDIRPYRI